MSDTNSTKQVLFRRSDGRWTKKIRGRQVYFGRGDYASALAKYEEMKDDLFGAVDLEPEGLTVNSLSKKFLTTKLSLLDSGDLSRHTIKWYSIVCKMLCNRFGRSTPVAELRADHFEKLRTWMARRWSPVRVGNMINGTRCVFSFAVQNGLMDKLPIYGVGFARPSRKRLRKHRREKPAKMFEPSELRALIAKADPAMKAMIFLGLNCGFGNNDVALLPMSAVDLVGQWINYPRPKTEVDRFVPLWPETVAALEDWLAVRPKPSAGNVDRVFVTPTGNAWDNADNPVSRKFAMLMKRCKVAAGRGSFYTLRHVFETIGGESCDQVGVDNIMGHADGSMAGHYRETISEKRLRRVTEFVRRWLFEMDGEPDLIPMERVG
jgi:integrase